MLLAKEITVLAEYTKFSNVFSKKSAKVLSEHTKIKKYVIQLEEGKQPLYRSIYSLGPVELKTLKTYIKTNLANGFIWSSKSSARAPILFVYKPNGSLLLYINYQSLNNLTIKNRNSLSLIGESLDWLRQAKRFT